MRIITGIHSAFNWLREHDAVDLAHIRKVCLHQGVANTDWSGFIRDNDPYPGHCLPMWNTSVHRTHKLAARQQEDWEEVQRQRQLAKNRIADIEWVAAEKAAEKKRALVAYRLGMLHRLLEEMQANDNPL